MYSGGHSVLRHERGHERVLLGLRHGDPHDELLGAWLAKESVRDIYLTEDPKVARILLDKAIIGCQGDNVEEIRSLGDNALSTPTRRADKLHLPASPAIPRLVRAARRGRTELTTYGAAPRRAERRVAARFMARGGNDSIRIISRDHPSVRMLTSRSMRK